MLVSLLVLRPGWVVCGEAENAKEAISKATELRHDPIVLDCKLQTSDGISAADGILRAMRTVPIVMFTLRRTVPTEEVRAVRSRERTRHGPQGRT